MTRTELIIQLLKLAIGLAFGAYFVWWSLEVLDRLAPEEATVISRVTCTPTQGFEATREAAMAPALATAIGPPSLAQHAR